MKKALTTVAFTFLALASSTFPVAANEGRIILRNNSLLCEGVSIWRDGQYRLTGRCAGLVYPYAERLDKYVLWTEGEGEDSLDRVDSIDLGYFDGRTDQRFDRVFITVEDRTNPRVPGDIVLASATILPFNFQVSSPSTPSAQTQPVTRSTPTPSPAPIEETPRFSLGGAIRGVLVTLAVVVGIVIAAGLVIWVLSRSKTS